MAQAQVASKAERESKPLISLSLEDLKSDYMSDPVVDVDSMPAKFEEGDAFMHPVCISAGKSLSDMNKNRFYYAWMDRESAARPVYNGFRPVTRTCEAAFGPNGETLDESLWVGRNIVQKGTMVYHFCKWSYYEGMKSAPRKRGEKIVAGWDRGKRQDVGEGGFVSSTPQTTTRAK